MRKLWNIIFICSFRCFNEGCEQFNSFTINAHRPSPLSLHADIRFTGHMSRFCFLHKHIRSHLTHSTHTESKFTFIHTDISYSTYHPQVSRIHHQMVWGTWWSLTCEPARWVRLPCFLSFVHAFPSQWIQMSWVSLQALFYLNFYRVCWTLNIYI